MGRDEVAQHLKPENRHLGEYAALAGDAVRQDAIECRNPVRGDNQEALVKRINNRGLFRMRNVLRRAGGFQVELV